MNGTTLFHHDSTVIVSVCGVDAPTVVTSAEIDDRLGATYRRLRLRPGLLAGLAGITERRWWGPDVGFTDAAALAGAKALAESGVDPAGIGLLIDTSVARSHLEPSSAVAVHAALGLPTTCVNFDLGNACLGFLNGMHTAAHPCPRPAPVHTATRPRTSPGVCTSPAGCAPAGKGRARRAGTL